jgi:hypothetical protein
VSSTLVALRQILRVFYLHRKLVLQVLEHLNLNYLVSTSTNICWGLNGISDYTLQRRNSTLTIKHYKLKPQINSHHRSNPRRLSLPLSLEQLLGLQSSQMAIRLSPSTLMEVEAQILLLRPIRFQHLTLFHRHHHSQQPDSRDFHPYLLQSNNKEAHRLGLPCGRELVMAQLLRVYILLIAPTLIRCK